MQHVKHVNVIRKALTITYEAGGCVESMMMENVVGNDQKIFCAEYNKTCLVRITKLS